MKKILSLFAAVSLAVSMNAAAPANVESVDLGLPSGLKWATFNVGATAPEGYGDYFAWGETEPYYADTTTDPITWKTGKDAGYDWQSYCGSSSFDEWSTAPYDATTKNLKPEFDAATANWGSDWRMPTKAELDELKNNCTWTWTEDYNGTGIKGYIVTSKAEGNTNSIFLPFAGRYSALSLYNTSGSYWSSSLYEDYSSNAHIIVLSSKNIVFNGANRSIGLPVRPVYVSAPGPKVGDKFEDTTSGLWFEATAVGEANTVKVIRDNYSGTSYTVPDTVKYLDVDFAVTEIEEYAFATCSSLESVTIPASVATIGKDAFYDCSSLQSVTLSEGLLTIGEYAFKGCSALQTITIPAGVTTIGESAFEGCSSLESVTIPASVTTIEELAFAKCAGLTSVTFLGNACQDAIGYLAFDEVGKDAPVLLTLHGTWAKENLPDDLGNWYGGKFELLNDPTALEKVDGGQCTMHNVKFFHNGQLLIRKGNKHFNALGAEVK